MLAARLTVKSGKKQGAEGLRCEFSRFTNHSRGRSCCTRGYRAPPSASPTSPLLSTPPQQTPSNIFTFRSFYPPSKQPHPPPPLAQMGALRPLSGTAPAGRGAKGYIRAFSRSAAGYGVAAASTAGVFGVFVGVVNAGTCACERLTGCVAIGW